MEGGWTGGRADGRRCAYSSRAELDQAGARVHVTGVRSTDRQVCRQTQQGDYT